MKSIRTTVFTLLFAAAITAFCGVAQASARKNLSIAVFTYTAGLSSEERRLTLGLTAIASYRLESSMNLHIVPESEYSLLNGDPNAKLLFENNKAESSRVSSGLKADVIITGRIKKAGKSFAAEYRVFLAGDKGRAPIVKVAFPPSEIVSVQKKITAALFEKVLPGARNNSDSSYTSSASALRSFCSGVSLLNDGKTSDAMRELGSASRADQSFRDYDYFMGQYYAVKKFDYEKAIAHLGRITSRDKDDHAAHFWLGFTYYLKGDSALAIREFETAVKIKPFLPEAYAYLATLYKDRGQLDKVESYYRKALEYIPDSAALWYNLAGVQSQMDRGGDSISSLKRALDLNCNAFLPILKTDADFARIRKKSEFISLIREYSRKCEK